MARKRMFDYDVIGQENFWDLPMEAKALYFLLGMEADDEGFVNPKKVLRLYGGTEDSIKILKAKRFVIEFQSGVLVITDWKRNNYLDKNKVKPTIYLEERSLLVINQTTQKYEFDPSLTGVKPKLNQSLTKVNLEENSIEENSIEEYSLDNIHLTKLEEDTRNTSSEIELPFGEEFYESKSIR